jgi:hypothetical protein
MYIVLSCYSKIFSEENEPNDIFRENDHYLIIKEKNLATSLIYYGFPVTWIGYITISDDATITPDDPFYRLVFKDRIPSPNHYRVDKIMILEKIKIEDSKYWNDYQFCKEVVIKYGLLKYVKNKTPELCLLAVQKDGDNLLYVEDQTDEICLEAVKQNGMALRYVINKTYEICLEAVKQNGTALLYIDDQTEEMCLTAVTTNGTSLKYVKNQTNEICIAAIHQWNNAYRDIKNPTYEITTFAVTQCGIYVPNECTDEKLLKLAIKTSPYMYSSVIPQVECVNINDKVIRYIEEPSFQACSSAVEQCGMNIGFIKNKECRKQLKDIALKRITEEHALYIEFRNEYKKYINKPLSVQRDWLFSTYDLVVIKKIIESCKMLSDDIDELLYGCEFDVLNSVFVYYGIEYGTKNYYETSLFVNEPLENHHKFRHLVTLLDIDVLFTYMIEHDPSILMNDELKKLMETSLYWDLFSYLDIKDSHVEYENYEDQFLHVDFIEDTFYIDKLRHTNKRPYYLGR